MQDRRGTLQIAGFAPKVTFALELKKGFKYLVKGAMRTTRRRCHLELHKKLRFNSITYLS